MLAFAVPLGPDGVLQLGHAPPSLVFAVQRALVFRGAVAHARVPLSWQTVSGDAPRYAISYGFLGQEATTAVGYALLLAVGLGWLARRRGVPKRELFRLDERGAWLTLRVGLAFGGALLVVGAIAGLLGAALDAGATVRALLDELDMAVLQHPAGALLRSVVMIVLAPLAEETVFRGIVYRTLEGFLPAPVAAIFQATLFAAYHVLAGWPPVLLPLQYGFGLVAAYTLERTGSLAPGVLLHALGNAAALLLLATASGFPEAVFALF